MIQKIGTYILRCSNGRYYVGSTNNLGRRLFEHQTGKVLATKNVLPITSVFFRECSALKEARAVEHKLKVKKSRKIIEQIIQEGYIKFLDG